MYTYEDVEEAEVYEEEVEAVVVEDDIFDEDNGSNLPQAAVAPEVLFDDEDDEGEELTEDQLKELDTEENREYLEQVRRGIGQSRDLYWELAKNLHHVKENKLHKLIGFKSWKSYVQTEVGFNTRTAGYYTSLYEYYGVKLRGILADRPDLYDMTIENIKRIGWTKSEIISKKNILKADNVEKIFEQITTPNEKGRLPSVKAVEKIVEDQISGMDEVEKIDADESNENLNAFVRLNLKFTPAQHNPVQDALDIAKEICGSEKKPSSLVSWICGEFTTNYSTDRGEPVTMDKAMGRMEDSLDVDIVAIDRKTGKVIHGVEKYDEISAQ